MKKLIIDKGDKYSDREMTFSRDDGVLSVYVKVDACTPDGNFPAFSEITLTPNEARALRRFLAPRWLRWLM